MPRAEFPVTPTFDMTALTADGHAALSQAFDGEHHNMVPLVDRTQLDGIVGSGATFAVDGVAAFTLTRPTNSPRTFSVAEVVVPPHDVDRRAFLELCVGLNEEVLRPMDIDGEVLAGVVDSGTLVFTGVAKFVNKNNSDHGYGALLVPRALIGLGPQHPDYPQELFATDVAAAMFDTLVQGLPRS